MSSIATSPSASDAGAAAPTEFVVVGAPSSKRVELFQAALGRVGQSPARVVLYADLLAGRVALPEVVRPGAVVRIDSPDMDFAVERALLELGADVEDDEDVGDEGGEYARAARRTVAELAFDGGAILYPRQWYLGYRELLRHIERQLAECPRTP